MREPETREEWQDAVDAAKGCLALESARLYGLVTGGPDVNGERCLAIIERGAAIGVTPADDVVDRFISETVAMQAEKT